MYEGFKIEESYSDFTDDLDNQSEESWEGFEPLDLSEEVDAAELFLKSHDPDRAVGDSVNEESSLFGGNGSSFLEPVNTAPAYVMELNNLLSLPETTQQYALNLLKDPALTGATSKNYMGDDTYMVGVDSEVALKTFDSFSAGVGPENVDWVIAGLESNLRKINDSAGKHGIIGSTNIMSEQIKAVRMLGGIEEIQDLGPGKKLVGNEIELGRQIKQAEGVEKFSTKLQKYAELYNRDATKEADPELYNARVDATKNKLTSWLMDSHEGMRVIDSRTGLTMQRTLGNGMTEDIFSSTIVPLPSDLNIFGIKSNASSSGKMGSPHDRVSYANLFPSMNELTNDGEFVWDKEVYDASEAAKFTEKELMRLSPNAANSLFTFEEIKEGKYKEMQKDFKSMSSFVRKLTVTNVDENWNNHKRSKQLGITEEEALKSEAFNAAAIYDLDRNKVNDVDLTLNKKKDFQPGLSIKGSDRGGIHRNEGLSESDLLRELVLEGMSVEDAVDQLNERAIPEALAPKDTDESRYDARVAKGLEDGTYFHQGTEEWLDQKKDAPISGSISKRLKTDKGRARLARDIVEDRPFVSNAAIAEGNKYESIASEGFESYTGLKVKEAFFEKRDDLEGFGVSPDGYVFDHHGNAKGIAEFKVHNTVKSMEKGMDRYYDQAQLQMAITKEKNVHFFRINKETSDIRYTDIPYDEIRANELIAGGHKVLNMLGSTEEEMEKEEMRRNLDLTDEQREILSEKGTAYKSAQVEAIHAQQAFRPVALSSIQVVRQENQMWNEAAKLQSTIISQENKMWNDENKRLSDISKAQDREGNEYHKVMVGRADTLDKQENKAWNDYDRDKRTVSSQEDKMWKGEDKRLSDISKAQDREGNEYNKVMVGRANTLEKQESQMWNEYDKDKRVVSSQEDKIWKEEDKRLNDISKAQDREGDEYNKVMVGRANTLEKQENQAWNDYDRDKRTVSSQEDKMWKDEDKRLSDISKAQDKEGEEYHKIMTKRAKDLHDEQMQNTKIDLQAKLKATDEHNKKVSGIYKVLTSATSSMMSMIGKSSEDNMDLLRRSNQTGADVERVQGLVNLVSSEGNLSYQQSKDLVFGANQLQADASGANIPSFIAKNKRAVMAAALEGVDFKPFQIDEMRNLKPEDTLAFVKEKIDKTPGMNNETRGKLWSAFNLSDGSMLENVSTDDMNSIRMTYEEDKLRSTDTGIKNAEILDRAAKQATAANTGKWTATVGGVVDNIVSNPMDVAVAGTLSVKAMWEQIGERLSSTDVNLENGLGGRPGKVEQPINVEVNVGDKNTDVKVVNSLGEESISSTPNRNQR